MSATRERLHQHERPLAAPRPVFRPGDRVLAIVLLVVTLLLALQIGGIATHATGISAFGAVWRLWPLLITAMLLIIYASRYAERRARKPLPGLRLGLILAVLAFATFAMIRLHSNEQRCVDKNTMTVVAAANCQHQGRPGTTGSQDSDGWYYLGRGTQTGDRVQGGSFTRPDAGSGGNGDTGGAGGDGSE
jgi:uncharacterized membrane protein YgcG